MPTAREIVTRWGFDINEAPLKSMEKSVSGLKHLVEAVFAGEATKKIWEFVQSTAEAGEEAARTAQRIGVQTQAYMGLSHAAYMSDVANEELTTSLKFLSRHMFDASKGSAEAQRNFQILGVKTKNSSGQLRGADEVLGDIAEKFSTMPDGAKKTALAVETFGRGGVAMIPMLNKGRAELAKYADEAKQFGLVMDDKAIRQSELFMDSLKRLKMVFTGIKREVGAALIPAITQYITKIIEWVKANNQVIKQNMMQLFRELGRILTDIWKVIQTVVVFVKSLNTALGGTTSGIQMLMRALEILAAAKIIWFIVGAIGSIPAAIIAAAAVIYLVVDDIVGYFNGKKSLIGTFFDAMHKAFGKMPFIEVFFNLLKNQLYDVVHLVDYIKEGWFIISNSVAEIVESIKDLFKMGLPPSLTTLISGAAVRAGNALLGTQQTVATAKDVMKGAGVFGIGPAAVAPQPASNVSGGWTRGNTLTFSPNITMDFTGAGAMNNPHAIRTIVMEALESEHRKAMKDFAKVVER